MATTTSRIFDIKRIAARTLLAISACCLAPTAVAADDLIGQWYMQPRLKLNTPNNGLQNFNHQTISIGRALDKRIDLEISLLSSDSLDYRPDNQGILIDGRYYLKQFGQFSPYIAGGISSTRNFNSLDTSYHDPSTNLGLGFEHTLKGNGTKIQADIRYFMDDKQAGSFNNNNVNDWALSLGVSIPLSTDIFK